MNFSSNQVNSLIDRGFSRRHIGRMAGLFTAGAASLPFYSEYAMAQQAEQRIRPRGAMPPDAVRISSNENPLGPCKEGLEAIYKVAQFGGRYQPFGEGNNFVNTVAEVEGVKPDHVAAFAGSSDPLHRTVCAFASPTRSMVMANPGYGGNC